MNLRKLFFLNILVLMLIFGTRLFLCSAAESYHATVEDLSQDKYFPRVKQALINAKSSIDMVMYLVNFDPSAKKSPVNELVEELVNAHKRGVKVKVILDQNVDFSILNAGGEWQKQDKNDALFVYLKKQGVEAYYDNLYVTTHSKAIVIDKEIVITGSANWTASSLRRNQESSCLVKSAGLAKEFLEDFSEINIDYEASILDEERCSSVRLSNLFLQDPSLAPRMLTSRDEAAFDLYLFLLRGFDGNDKGRIGIDYKNISNGLGLDNELNYNLVRRRLGHALGRLDKKYRLINRKNRLFKSPDVILLNYSAETPYALPQEKYCSIPDNYWRYGWNKKLNFPEKYCYFINLYKIGTAGGNIWSDYVAGLSKNFNISKDTIGSGMKGLKKLNIIELDQSTYSWEKGFIERGPARFKMLGLYSPENLMKEKDRLVKIYGKERFDKAEKYAEIVYAGNDTQVIEDIIKKTEEYGPDQVDKAFSLVSGNSFGNPTRSYKYVIGILQIGVGNKEELPPS